MRFMLAYELWFGSAKRYLSIYRQGARAHQGQASRSIAASR